MFICFYATNEWFSLDVKMFSLNLRVFKRYYKQQMKYVDNEVSLRVPSTKL